MRQVREEQLHKLDLLQKGAVDLKEAEQWKALELIAGAVEDEYHISIAVEIQKTISAVASTHPPKEVILLILRWIGNRAHYDLIVPKEMMINTIGVVKVR